MTEWNDRQREIAALLADRLTGDFVVTPQAMLDACREIADAAVEALPAAAPRNERADFEAAFRNYFGSKAQPGEFDQASDFWFARLEGEVRDHAR